MLFTAVRMRVVVDEESDARLDDPELDKPGELDDPAVCTVTDIDVVTVPVFDEGVMTIGGEDMMVGNDMVSLVISKLVLTTLPEQAVPSTTNAEQSTVKALGVPRAVTNNGAFLIWSNVVDRGSDDELGDEDNAVTVEASMPKT